MGLLLAVQLRGTVNLPVAVRRTLRLLRLGRRFRAALVPDTPAHRGMLRRVRSYVAWAPADKQVVKRLLQTRGPHTSQPLEQLGYRDLDELADALLRGKMHARQLKPFRTTFALAPPRGGFRRSTRRPASVGGVLGENPRLAQLIERMLPVAASLGDAADFKSRGQSVVKG